MRAWVFFGRNDAKAETPVLWPPWGGLPFPSPGDLTDPGIEPGSPALQADSLPSETPTMLLFLL